MKKPKNGARVTMRDTNMASPSPENHHLIGISTLAASQQSFQVTYQSEYFFYVHFNKLIFPPALLSPACSVGMLKVTQGSADLFAFMRRSVCWERGVLTYRGCQLGSREHLTCRCQLGPKTFPQDSHTHTHTHT